MEKTEINYEQLYKDALERANVEYFTAKKDVGPLYAAITRIFPQLKSDEDEDVEEDNTLDFGEEVTKVLSDDENYIPFEWPNGGHSRIMNYRKMFKHFYMLGLGQVKLK
mgnify:CR=1 FL=1